MTTREEQDYTPITEEAMEKLREKWAQTPKELRKENQKLRERLWELEEDRFNRLSHHPGLKRITTNEKDGGFTFWF
jgi:hypothetical protein